MSESKRKNLLYIIAFGILFLLVLLAASYSYFGVDTSYDNNIANITSRIDCLDITYSESGVINLSNQYPMTDEYALAHLTPLTVTVTNNCATSLDEIDYVLAFTSLSQNSGYIPDSKIRISVKRKVGASGTYTTLFNPTYLSNLTEIQNNTTATILSNDLQNRGATSGFTNKTNYYLDINSLLNDTIYYQIYIWVDYYEGDTTHANTNGNSTQNLLFKGASSLVINSEDIITNRYYYGFEGETVTTVNARKVSDYHELESVKFYRRKSESVIQVNNENVTFITYNGRYTTSSACETALQSGETCEYMPNYYFMYEKSYNAIANVDLYELFTSLNGTDYSYYMTLDKTGFESLDLGYDCPFEEDFDGMYVKCVMHHSGSVYEKTDTYPCINLKTGNTENLVCVDREWNEAESLKTEVEGLGGYCNWLGDGSAIVNNKASAHVLSCNTTSGYGISIYEPNPAGKCPKYIGFNSGTTERSCMNDGSNDPGCYN